MNEEVFKLLTGLIVKGRRITGPVSSDRILKEPGYAREVFRKIEEEGDEELVLLSLKLREHLGQLTAVAEPSSPEPPETPPKNDGKYKFGARS